MPPIGQGLRRRRHPAAAEPVVQPLLLLLVLLAAGSSTFVVPETAAPTCGEASVVAPPDVLRAALASMRERCSSCTCIELVLPFACREP